MCTEDSPSGLWRTLGKRVGCKPSGVRIPHPPPPDPGTASGSGVFVACTPPDLRPPRVLPALMGRAAVCAGGRRPAREPSAPRASLGASSRSPARPRHRPPAPRPGPPAPSTPAALVSLGLARPGPAAAHRHRGQAHQTSRALRTGGACGAVCAGRQSGGHCAAEPRPRPPLDSEPFDDLCARERGQDLARHKELRSAQARADAAPSDRARRVDEEPP